MYQTSKLPYERKKSSWEEPVSLEVWGSHYAANNLWAAIRDSSPNLYLRK